MGSTMRWGWAACWWLLCGLACGACGGSGTQLAPADLRARLRAAMQQNVESRQQRDELSRVLVEAADGGALDRLTRPEVRAAFGPGLACEAHALCDEQGFVGSDWYYPIGTTRDPKIKQLPVLIVGFDTHDRVSRVYTLKTH